MFLMTWILRAALLALLPVGAAGIAWIASGGIGKALHNAGDKARQQAATIDAPHISAPHPGSTFDRAWHSFLQSLSDVLHAVWTWSPLLGIPLVPTLIFAMVTVAIVSAVSRTVARFTRRKAAYRIAAFRTDRALLADVMDLQRTLHKRLLVRWWQRLLSGQPSITLRTVLAYKNGVPEAHLVVLCPPAMRQGVQSALRAAYPNTHLRPYQARLSDVPCVLRLKKRKPYIQTLEIPDPRWEAGPAMDELLNAMRAVGQECFVDFELTPAPNAFDHLAKRAYMKHEQRVRHVGTDPRAGNWRSSKVEEEELTAGLDLQNEPLFFADIRIVAHTRSDCEQIASELRAGGDADNALVERGTSIRHGLLRLYRSRILNGRPNPIPSLRKGVYVAGELAALWHYPSTDFTTVPFHRSSVPVAPAPPAIARPRRGEGLGSDEHGPITLHPQMRRQNTAVVGTVEQGKTSYLVATIEEDLRRPDACVIVMDPKGDAADAAISMVPEDRICTILDFANPTCGFNPLAVDAPPDTIADYVVGAMVNLFDEGDIKASSDRYLRNAIIAALAANPRATLWDVALLLSATDPGIQARADLADALRNKPEYKEVRDFFVLELKQQLLDSKSTTTAKLDAPSNKLSRLLSSLALKAVLRNDSLQVNFDEIIASKGVLIVKGALGTMGKGNTSVLMQLLVGMLDASLARQQDQIQEGERVAVCLKVDEAPLVINRGFGSTMAVKRSARLETVACWQTNSQWTDMTLRSQLDALFAHRVYFATASLEDARAAASLMQSEFTDNIRTNDDNLSKLGRPDTLTHLPKHTAAGSLTTPQGRQQPFVFFTRRIVIDPRRIEHHYAVQAARGGRALTDFSMDLFGAAAEPVLTPPEGAALHPEAGAPPERIETPNGLVDESIEHAQAAEREAEADAEALAIAAAFRADREAKAAWSTSGQGAAGGTITAAPPADPAPQPTAARVSAPAVAAPDQAHDSFDSQDTEATGAREAQAPPPGDTSDIVGVAGPIHDRATETDSAPISLDHNPAHPVPPAGADTDPIPERAKEPGQREATIDRNRREEAEEPQLPVTLSPSYVQVAELDDFPKVKWARPPATLKTPRLDLVDYQILQWVAELKYALTPHIRERWLPDVTESTVNRRLAKLYNAGLLNRFQFVAKEGRGQTSACYMATPATIELLERTDGPHGIFIDPKRKLLAPSPGDREAEVMTKARHDLHVTGWVLAFEHMLGPQARRLRGENGAYLGAPYRRQRTTEPEIKADTAPDQAPVKEATKPRVQHLGPGDLVLPNGRTAEGFEITEMRHRRRVPVDAFTSIAPDAAIEVRLQAGQRIFHTDVLVEFDNTGRASKNINKIECYDHFLTGWVTMKDRYTKVCNEPPIVVFVCRDWNSARDFARQADQVVTAARGYSGLYDHQWDYVGRDRMFFTAERAIHEGRLDAYKIDTLPPEIRVNQAGGDPAARACNPQMRSILSHDLVEAGRRQRGGRGR